MKNLVVVGTQWGDEGKGKIVDLLTGNFDVIARAQGGHNAGHTVIIDRTKYILHLIPSGILHPGKICVIGNGVVFDPFAFREELVDLSEIDCRGRLFISDRCHLIMPYHREVEKAEEALLGENRIGTTNRGIGPAYEDKVARRGIRLGDMSRPEIFRKRLGEVVRSKNLLLKQVYNSEPLDPGQIYDDYMHLADLVMPMVTDTSVLLNRLDKEGKKILFEGAQGALLDIDHGTYPFVTSSNSTSGGVCTGTGIGPARIDGVLGISKAYTTRVGAGPFPTEYHGSLGESFRSVGDEYGASTGRPRRCGCFDAVITRYSCNVNSVSTLVITKLDVLDQLDQIEVCTGYRYKDEILDTVPMHSEILDEVEPVIETWKGWQKTTSGIREYGDLPPEARDYLKRLRDLLETDISIISVGPDREDTLYVDDSPYAGQFRI
ncbi:MAG: adenylosuccinate synthase [Acidobacteriota bacterium]